MEMVPIEIYTHPDKRNVIDSALSIIIAENELQLNILHLNESETVHLDVLNDRLPERMKVSELIVFWLKWYDLRQDVALILEKYHLTPYAAIYYKDLQPPQRRLLQIAKLAIKPYTKIILKEPLQNIDIETKDRVIALLKEISASKQIICLTNNTEEAMLLSNNCYRLTPHDFKPIQIQENNNETPLEEAVPRTLQVRRIAVKVNDKTMLLDPIDIDYVESQDGKVLLHVDDEVYSQESTLQKVEDIIRNYGFYRCHRSYIVNLQKISEIVSWSKNTYSLRLNNSKSTLIPLSRQKIKEIEQHFDLSL